MQWSVEDSGSDRYLSEEGGGLSESKLVEFLELSKSS